MVLWTYKRILFIQIASALILISVCFGAFYLHGKNRMQSLVFSHMQSHMEDVAHVVYEYMQSGSTKSIDRYLKIRMEKINGIKNLGIAINGKTAFSALPGMPESYAVLPDTTDFDSVIKDNVYVHSFPESGLKIVAETLPNLYDDSAGTFRRDLSVFAFAVMFLLAAVQFFVYYLMHHRFFMKFYQDISSGRLNCRYPVYELNSLSKIISQLFDRLRHTSEESQHQKDLFRTMFYSMPIAAYYKDKHGRYLGGNPAFCRLIGSTEREILGKTVFDILEPKIAEELERKDRVLVSNPESMQVYEEEIYVTSIKKSHNIIYYKSALKDPEGKPDGILAVMMDITEIRRLEEEIINEKDRLEQMFRSHSAAMLIVDAATGKILDANDATVRFTGYSMAELLGRTSSEVGIVDKEEAEEVRRAAIDKDSHYAQLKCRLKNGTIKDVDIYSTTITTKDSSVIFTISHDITEKMRQQRITLLQTAIAEAFLLSDEKETFSQVSRALNKAFNCSFSVLTYTANDKNEINPLNVATMDTEGITTSITDNKDVIGHLSLYGKKGGFGFEDREDMLTVAGLISPVLKHWYRNKFHEQNLQDEKKALEIIVQKEMENKKKQEEIIFEQKKFADMGQMINAVAHHWRQPLNAMGLLVQSLEDAYEDKIIDENYIRDFESSSMRMIKYLSETIDNFRYFFTADKEKIYFNAPDEMINLLSLLNIQIKDKNISVRIRCACGLELGECQNFSEIEKCSYHNLKIFGYLGEFKQSVINILYNAVDAVTEAAEKRIIPKGIINIEMSADDDTFCIAVADNGGGIPDEIKFRIFDPYFSTKMEGKGTGLGLYMTRLMIENHMDGSVRAENTDSGAKFTIMLPIAGNGQIRKQN